MGELGGFLKIHRVGFQKRDPQERVRDYERYFDLPDEAELQRQGGRCMDCGVPFCHEGCPLGNLIPDWNDLVYKGRWEEAIVQLHATNNFPEFTGLICPAPCESACVLDINDDAVTIEQIELAIAERAWDEGWITPEPPKIRTRRRIAVVGSGPAGLAVADQLNELGHTVTIFERDEAPGGLMRFGVPDAKLDKAVIDRRVGLIEAEGVDVRCNVDVGVDISADDLRAQHDAVILAIGSRVHRDLAIPGRELGGVHFAMDYLYQRNRAVARADGRPARDVAPEDVITAAGKHVIVVGGGDTGMDCISNALREGAASATMLDVYPELPPSGRHESTPWPLPPKRTLTTYALDEGGERQWNAEVIELRGADGRVTTAVARQVEGTSSRNLRPIEGSEYEVPADLVLIAIGFSHPQHRGLIDDLGVDLDARGNVKAGVYETSLPGVFACGDARIGQSLVVTAIAEARKCARMVDRYLGKLEPIEPIVIDDEPPTLEHSLRDAARTARNVNPGDPFFDTALIDDRPDA